MGSIPTSRPINSQYSKGHKLIKIGETTEMDKYIKIRVDEETKNKFYNKCDSEAINPSKLIRKLINDWLEEHQD